MAISANEQYLLELVNRARLDPASEAARFGLSDLNRGLDPGTITVDPKQPLAANDLLNIAAAKHSQWMLDTNVFSHTGEDGSTPTERAQAVGYEGGVGENISWSGTTGELDFDAQIDSHHRNLFLSDGHRANILQPSYVELGLGQVEGMFTSEGYTYNASMLTQKFGNYWLQNPIFLTGVIYNDSDGDNFYSRGEGVSGVSVSIAGGATTASAAAGGYAIATESGQKTISIGGATVTVDISDRNGKLDLVDGNHVMTSVDINLHSGVSKVTLLGAGNINATGTDGPDRIIGNSGNNILAGGAGDDVLIAGGGDNVLRGGPGDDVLISGPGNNVLGGGGGNDTASYERAGAGVTVDLGLQGQWQDTGGAGTDRLINIQNLTGSSFDDMLIGNDGDNVLRGGAGDDVLIAGGGDNRLFGGRGDDVLYGGPGRDVLIGGPGADRFVYTDAAHIGKGAARDVIRDFEPGTDLLDLAGIDANPQLAGNQPFSFIGAAAFTQAGQLRYENSMLSGDLNGNGQADLELWFANSALLSIDDFLV